MPLEMPRRKFIAAAMAAAASPAAPLFGAAATDLATLTLKQASDLVRRRDASPVDLAQACFNRIDKYDKSINAFITVTRDQALATAREMEAELKSGKWRGPLHGIPIALKDNIDNSRHPNNGRERRIQGSYSNGRCRSRCAVEKCGRRSSWEGEPP